MDEVGYSSLKERPVLQACNTAYYGLRARVPLEVLGQFVCTVKVGGRCGRASYIVVRGQGECLMSCKTAEDLGVISFNMSVTSAVDTVAHSQQTSEPVLFESVGRDELSFKKRLPSLFFPISFLFKILGL